MEVETIMLAYVIGALLTVAVLVLAIMQVTRTESK